MCVATGNRSANLNYLTPALERRRPRSNREGLEEAGIEKGILSGKQKTKTKRNRKNLF